MAGSLNTEIRAALRNEKRVGAAISTGAGFQCLRLFVGAVRLGRPIKQPCVKPKPGSLAMVKDESREAPLTPRELQILTLVAKGFHNRQIAARIHRSIKTVEKHRQHLHSKLSTHEVAGLTRQALLMGLMDESKRSTTKLARDAKQLTPRELEVLKLVAQGSCNKWIASELRRSIKTIDHHRENIMKKLGIHEVAGLTRHAFAIGLL